MVSFGCFAPRYVVDKTHNKVIKTFCGRCDYCISSRSFYYSGIVSRAFKSGYNTQYFITLTYNNENIPLYSEVGNGLFVSNRFGIPDIILSENDEYVVPQGIEGRCFAHLYYKDVQRYLSRLRANIYKYCKRESLNYEDFKYKYFVCGEYGPYSYRPHYHLLLFFRGSVSEFRYKALYKIICSSWSLGIVDFEPVTTAGVGNYLSAYVSSVSNLPVFLQNKYVRPFARYSYRDSFGSFVLDESEIFEALISGAYEKEYYDHKTQEFRIEFLPPTFFVRYFPKCKGFGIVSNSAKLFVYSYVYRYFKKKGIKHSKEEVKRLKPSDIVFTTQFYRGPKEVEPRQWSYEDIRASLQAYRYCVIYGFTPSMVLDAFNRVYTRRFSEALRSFYENIADKQNKDYAVLYDNLGSYFPARLEYLTDFNYDYIEWLGLDIDRLYIDSPSGFVLNKKYLDYICGVGNSVVSSSSERFAKLSSDLVKTKKMNDYKSRKEVVTKKVNYEVSD